MSYYLFNHVTSRNVADALRLPDSEMITKHHDLTPPRGSDSQRLYFFVLLDLTHTSVGAIGRIAVE